VVKLDQLHSSPQRDVVSSLVYSTVASDVQTTIIDGQVLMRNGELLTLNEASVIEEANREATNLAERAGVS
jgi:5-methylthioadenosine/S-adenosylhomocysteine deaminase